MPKFGLPCSEYNLRYNEDLKTNEWSKPARIQVAEENIQAISDFLRFQ